MLPFILVILIANFVGRRMYSAAGMVFLALCAQQLLVTPPQQLYENVITLGNRYPILKTIGDILHGKPLDQKIPVASKVEKTKEDWILGPKKSLKLLTDKNLENPDGQKMFLVMLGHVFQVTETAVDFIPSPGYFSVIAFEDDEEIITGRFDKEGLISDVSGLSSSNYKDMDDWLQIYMNDKSYIHIGYFVGRFFNENGDETEEMKDLKRWVLKAREEDEAENDLKKLFPPCNVQWSVETGTVFDCTKGSGGINRDWTGVPRKFYEEKSESPRCACVHPNQLADPRIKKYPNCDPKSVTCNASN